MTKRLLAPLHLLLLLRLQTATALVLPNKGPLSGFANVYDWYNQNVNPKNADKEESTGLLPPQPLPKNIPLTVRESELFRAIRHVRDEYCPKTTIRIAGGWVRDKLLGRTLLKTAGKPQDIDFVLSDQSGADFARLFYSYLVNQTDDASHIYWKDYNETQSHHLQTARLCIGDQLDIDFAQLRQEVYQKNSRVPQQSTTASIVEDAFRRDLTINALYYNLNTNQVEDWTELGVRDLQRRNIATPRAPRTTLLEDPLRILRAIRFAAQLSFRLDPKLKDITANDIKVQQALTQKVSRERMGKEVDGIFQTNDPSTGVRLLLETNLMKIVFPLPNLDDDQEQYATQMYTEGFLSLVKTQTLVSRVFTELKDWDPSKRQWLWYAAFCKPISDLQQQIISASSNNNNNTSNARQPKQSKKGRRQVSTVYQLLTKGLKRPTTDTQSVETILQGANTLEHFLTDTISIPDNLTTPEQQMAHLRWQAYQLLQPMGNLWKESLLLALASFAKQEVAEVVRQYKLWVTLVEDRLGVQEALESNWKPLLNGKQIQKQVLPGIHGKGFRQVMSAQEEWQVKQCVFPREDTSASQESMDSLTQHLIGSFPEYT